MSKHKHGSGNAAQGSHGGDASHGGHGAGDGAHVAHGPTKGDFVTVFLILAFLTVVEVFIPSVYDSPWNQHTKMLLLCMLAFGKALLVALFFMHLKWESPWLTRIALVPAYMGVAAVLLMLETAYRNSLS